MQISKQVGRRKSPVAREEPDDLSRLRCVGEREVLLSIPS